MMATAVAMARPVDVQRARGLVEANFFAPAVCISPAAWGEIYVFAPVAGEGFVVVSADDCARPVLAYSMTGSFPVENMPPHVAAWIEGYRHEIADLVKYGAVPSAEVQAQWANPKNGRYQPVAPLMTTTWNQSPRYNAMCPFSYSDSSHAVTGCVATAQAQVMKYWNHPAKGHGSHSYVDADFGPQSVDYDTLYQWNLMPDALSWASSQEEIHAVAQLMYHVGVSVEMNYTVGGSGAYVIAYSQYGLNYPSTERALREHFGYNPMLEGRVKEMYTDDSWSSMVRNEIVHGRPVLYSGADSESGHAFVLDGYDSTGMFHLNWGWGGYYDGYYTIDSLSPGAGGIGGNATYTFNLQNTALFGVRPCYNTDSMATVGLVTSDSTKGVVLGSGTYIPYEDTVHISVVPAPGYRFAGWASGYSMPIFTFVPNGDMIDTALFEPIGTDTVAYCDDICAGRWRDDYGSTTEWGIRVPAERRNALRSLDAVQLFVYEPGFYTMNIYCGSAPSTSTRLLSMQPDLTEAHGWTTIQLDQPLAVPDSQDVWITFRFTTTTGFPAAASHYTAVSDGCWYKLPDGWRPIDETGVYYTWMIRALFEPRPCHVAVENAGYCDLAALYGAGEYELGDTVTVGCDDPLFTHWEGSGSTARSLTFVATGDTAFYAYCHEVGIDEVEGDPLTLGVDGLTVSVQGPEGEPLNLYDMQGRLLAAGTGRLQCRVHSAGVYLLRPASLPARKIVVVE